MVKVPLQNNKKWASSDKKRKDVSVTKAWDVEFQ